MCIKLHDIYSLFKKYITINAILNGCARIKIDLLIFILRSYGYIINVYTNVLPNSEQICLESAWTKVID